MSLFPFTNNKTEAGQDHGTSHPLRSGRAVVWNWVVWPPGLWFFSLTSVTFIMLSCFAECCKEVSDFHNRKPNYPYFPEMRLSLRQVKWNHSAIPWVSPEHRSSDSEPKIPDSKTEYPPTVFPPWWWQSLTILGVSNYWCARSPTKHLNRICPLSPRNCPIKSAWLLLS